MSANNIKIIGYRPEHKSRYKTLNYEWLNKYFEIEPYDEELLSDPEGEILKEGGYIFFATIDYEVIGTCTLIKIDSAKYELTKMCVTEKAQRKGAGKKLLDAAIDKARELGAEEIYVSTGTILSAALHLYQTNGFRVIDNKNAPTKKYNRTELSMVLDIDSKTREHKKTSIG